MIVVLFFNTFTIPTHVLLMLRFIGDYQSKFDTKGRVIIPSSFRKVMQSMTQDLFVVRKNIYENCLDLYPYAEWEKQITLITSKLNLFNKAHSAFLREYYRNLSELNMDANGRILINSRLLESVNIDKDVMILGLDSKIEIWSEKEYEKASIKNDDYMNLAEDILSKSLDRIL